MDMYFILRVGGEGGEKGAMDMYFILRVGGEGGEKGAMDMYFILRVGGQGGEKKWIFLKATNGVFVLYQRFFLRRKNSARKP
jgi:hypothetical protein